MFVLNPDRYLLPDYKISPFATGDMFRNGIRADSESPDEYFKVRLGGSNFRFTYNGRSALNKALAHYRLKPADKVTILTTSSNAYVSSCVTSEINKYCGWNREVTSETRVILVIHEFGYPYEDLDSLRELGIPIIEDCAYAFFSQNLSGTIGRVGEFAVFSFPKMFPMQIGGLISSQLVVPIEEEVWPAAGMEDYVKQTLSLHLQEADEIIQKRLRNYDLLRSHLKNYGFIERFPLRVGVVPGVYLFSVSRDIDLQAMKDFLKGHGIQCSVFYGEKAFFLPIHQRLSEEDLEYFVFVIDSFLQQNA